MKHYAQVTNDHFERAIGGKKSGADVAQKEAQQVIAQKSKEMTISKKLTTKPLTVSLFVIPCESQVLTAKGLSGAEGIRTNAKTPGNTAFLEKSGAESGALEVLELWPHLSLSQAEAIVRIVREGL